MGKMVKKLATCALSAAGASQLPGSKVLVIKIHTQIRNTHPITGTNTLRSDTLKLSNK
jgi:hypothetical protein